MADLRTQALACLEQGNTALQGGHFQDAIAAYTAGLGHMPLSCGLLLNRSIAYEKLSQSNLDLNFKSKAFDDLRLYLQHTGEQEGNQNGLALKRFISLGIELAQLPAILQQLKHLEDKPFWRNADFYDLLIGLILANPGSEDTLMHYVSRANHFSCLAQKTLEHVCDFLILQQAGSSFNEAKSNDSDVLQSLMYQLACSESAPAFLVPLWLKYVLPSMASEAERIQKITEVLSLWMLRHELDEEFIDLLILTLFQQNQVDSLESLFLQLAQRYPEKSQYMLGLVRTRFFKRDVKKAYVIVSALVAADPTNIELLLERARIASELNDPAISLEDINQILLLDPNHIEALLHKVDILADMGQLEEALKLHQTVTEDDLTPKQRLGAAIQKSFICRISGREQEWFEQVDAIVREYPDGHQTHSELAWKELYLGDWKQGLLHLEARFFGKGHYYAIAPHLESLGLTRWSPELLAQDVKGKRLILSSEEGLGDAIQFIRFIPLLLNKGLHITLVCADALQTFFQFNYPQLTVKTKKQLLEEMSVKLKDQYDFFGELMSAPYVLGLELSDLDPKPYLKADNSRVEQWAQKLPQRMNQDSKESLLIGLRWMGSFSRVARKIPLELFAPLSGLPISIMGLQFGDPTQAEKDIYSKWSNFYPTNLAVDELAALMMHLDCVVTCDTMTAHLAGALGRPTILIKPVWRAWVWGQSGHQSSWYESMYIIRQQQFLNWDSAMAELMDQLELRINAKSSIT